MQITLTVPDDFQKLPELRRQQIVEDLEMQIQRELEEEDQDFIAFAKEALNTDKFKKTLNTLVENYDPNKEYPNTIKLS